MAMGQILVCVKPYGCAIEWRASGPEIPPKPFFWSWLYTQYPGRSSHRKSHFLGCNSTAIIIKKERSKDFWRLSNLYLYFSDFYLVLKTSKPANVSSDEGVCVDCLKTTNGEKHWQSSKDFFLILLCQCYPMLHSLSRVWKGNRLRLMGIEGILNERRINIFHYVSIGKWQNTIYKIMGTFQGRNNSPPNCL